MSGVVREFRIEKNDVIAVSISSKRVMIWLGGFVVLLCGISFLAKLASAMMGSSGFVPSLLSVLFVTEDQSVPSWYSSFALLGCAFLLALISFSVRRRREPYFFHWAMLGVIFLYLSIDEGVGIHERTGPIGEAIARAAGFENTEFRTWVIPGAIFTAIVGLLYVGFIRALPARTRNGIIIAGIVFVSGALGMEILHEVYVRVNGGLENLSVIQNIIRDIVLPHIEEFLEMLGILIFIYVLLGFLGDVAGEYRFHLDGKSESDGSR